MTKETAAIDQTASIISPCRPQETPSETIE